MSNDNIIGRLIGDAYNDRAQMEVVVVLHDPATGEAYRFRFGTAEIPRGNCRAVHKYHMLITIARSRLAKQWGSIYG